MIDISVIEKYNEVLTQSKKNYLRPEQSASVKMLRFTLMKKAIECEEKVIAHILDLSNNIKATYVCFGLSGIAFIINKRYKETDTLYKIKEQLSVFGVESLQQPGHTTPLVENSSHTWKQQGTYSTHSTHTLDYITFFVAMHPERYVKHESFLLTNSDNYGVYDCLTGKKLTLKRAKIIDFYYKLGYLTQSGRYPLPDKTPDGINFVSDALKFINAISTFKRSPWKTAALKAMFSGLRFIRWPNYKDFAQHVKMSV